MDSRRKFLDDFSCRRDEYQVSRTIAASALSFWSAFMEPVLQDSHVFLMRRIEGVYVYNNMVHLSLTEKWLCLSLSAYIPTHSNSCPVIFSSEVVPELGCGPVVRLSSRGVCLGGVCGYWLYW